MENKSHIKLINEGKPSPGKKFQLIIETRKGDRFTIPNFSERKIGKFLKKNAGKLDNDDVLAFNHKEGFVMIPMREITYLCFFGYKNKKKGL